jgi:hypothetical protein
MKRSYSELQHKDDSAAAALRPYGLGPADHVQGRLVLRRGRKWWTCGNGGFPDFHDAAGNHFQVVRVEMQEVQGCRHFHISKIISTDMEASRTGEYHEPNRKNRVLFLACCRGPDLA